jgi:GNAT superfamily N-acetyltransferase
MADEHADERPATVGVAAAGQSGASGQPGGSWYGWWRGDPLPALPPLDGLTVARADDADTIAAIARLSADEAHRRLTTGNRAYVARVHGAVVAHGWSATRAVEIGEISLTFTLPPGDHYLWAFATAPDWRGRGIYPRLLQAILRAEMDEAARFWIGHEPGNAASARGILKAGFTHMGDLFILPSGGMALAPTASLERAREGADVLGAALLG